MLDTLQVIQPVDPRAYPREGNDLHCCRCRLGLDRQLSTKQEPQAGNYSLRSSMQSTHIPAEQIPAKQQEQKKQRPERSQKLSSVLDCLQTAAAKHMDRPKRERR
jgi:hypothetical protein